MRTTISLVAGALLAATVAVGATPAPTGAEPAAADRSVPPAVAAAGAHQTSGAVQNLDGRLEVFCQCGGGIKHSYEMRPGGPWSPLLELSASEYSGRPEVIRNRDGRLELFARGSNGIEHQWQLWPGGAWSPLVRLVGRDITRPAFSFTSMSVTINRDGRLEVFYAGCGDQGDGCEVGPFFGHLFQETPGGTWSSPSILRSGSSVGNLTAFANPNGDLEVIMIGAATVSFRQHGYEWSETVLPPAPLPHAFQLQAARNADGRAELFATTGYVLYHAWQDRPGGSWSAFVPLATSDDVAYFGVGRNADGRLEVVIANNLTKVATHLWQEAAGSGWSGEAPLAGNAQFLFGVLPDALGRLQVFTQPAPYQSISRAGQATAGAGPWSPFTNL